MRLNERELAAFASSPVADRDGRMYYKHLSQGSGGVSREGYKERWFKLKGNLLFYYKVNEYGGMCAGEPAGVFVMEDCIIETEDEACLPFSFSVTFNAEPDRKHMFSSSNQTSADEWVRVLRNASYEGLRQRVREMQSELRRITGKDPLVGFPHFAEY